MWLSEKALKPFGLAFRALVLCSVLDIAQGFGDLAGCAEQIGGDFCPAFVFRGNVGQGDGGDDVSGVVEDGGPVAEGQVGKLAGLGGIPPLLDLVELLQEGIFGDDGMGRIGIKVDLIDHGKLFLFREKGQDGLAQGGGVGGLGGADSAGGQLGVGSGILV